MTEPDPERLQDLMRRFGYEKKEAEAAYHLEETRRLFDEIFVEDEGNGFTRLLLHNIEAGALIRSLRRKLAMRVLRRNYPGWGYVPPTDEEEGD